MKKNVVIFFVILCIKGWGQKSQVIKINNSAFAVTLEAGMIDQTLKSEGDAKYYTFRPNNNGIGGVKEGVGSGFDAGFNFELGLQKNFRAVSVFAGIHFMQTKTNVFVSQGSGGVFWDWAIRYSDSVGSLDINAIHVPIGVQYFFPLGRKKNLAIGIDIGGNLYYNFSANLKKPSDPLGQGIENERKVLDAINKFYGNALYGVKLKYRRFYLYYDITAFGPKKIWTEDYGDNEDTKQTFQRLGIGFYLKK